MGLIKVVISWQSQRFEIEIDQTCPVELFKMQIMALTDVPENDQLCTIQASGQPLQSCSSLKDGDVIAVATKGGAVSLPPWTETCSRVLFGQAERLTQPQFDVHGAKICLGCATSCQSHKSKRLNPAPSPYACECTQCLFQDRFSATTISGASADQVKANMRQRMVELARHATTQTAGGDSAASNNDPRTRMFLGRLEGSASQVMLYESDVLRAKVRQIVPVAQLEDRASQKPGENWRRKLFVELLHWFKHEFFSWVNQPPCDTCQGETSMLGGVEPTPAERRGMAGRVELYQCQSCQSMTRFPRYNNPSTLLDTRRGRCGEWANCFCAIARALDYDGRYVVDWTDHVWVEVFDEAECRWMHCDPCEDALDSPMMYESGWGKKLSYVVAFSRYEVVDVTKRYTRQWAEVSTRRDVPEVAVASALRQADIHQRMRRPSPFSEAELSSRKKLEQQELEASHLSREMLLKEEEQRGRQSGSLAWRRARGEVGNSNNPQNSSGSYSLTLAKPSYSVGEPIEVRFSAPNRLQYLSWRGDRIELVDAHAASNTEVENVGESEVGNWGKEEGIVVIHPKAVVKAGTYRCRYLFASGSVVATSDELTLTSSTYACKLKVNVYGEGGGPCQAGKPLVVTWEAPGRAQAPAASSAKDYIYYYGSSNKNVCGKILVPAGESGTAQFSQQCTNNGEVGPYCPTESGPHCVSYMVGGVEEAGTVCFVVSPPASEDCVTWEKMEPVEGLPAPGAGDSRMQCTWNSSFWVYGGRTGEKGTKDTSELWCWMPEAGFWFQGSSLDSISTAKQCHPQRGAAMATVENELWLFGGRTLGKGPKPVVWEQLFVYDPETDSWSERETTGERPPALGYLSAASAAAKFFCFGGVLQGKSQGGFYCLDSKTMDWKRVHPQEGTLPPPRAMGQCLASDATDRVWIFGGRTGNETWEYTNMLNDLWEYTVSTNVLQRIDARSEIQPPPLSDQSFTYHKGDLYVFGGISRVGNSVECQNNLWKFDISSQQWKLLFASDSHRPCPRNLASLVSCGDDLWLCGGNESCDPMDDDKKVILSDLWRGRVN